MLISIAYGALRWGAPFFCLGVESDESDETMRCRGADETTSGRTDEQTNRRNDSAKPRTLYVVILNEVKNLLNYNTLYAWSLVGFEEILEFLYLAPPW